MSSGKTNVGTIGHIDHGKTTLPAALAKVCSGAWAISMPPQLDEPIPIINPKSPPKLGNKRRRRHRNVGWR